MKQNKKTDKPVICIDLDGTLIDTVHWKGFDSFGKPFKGARDFLQRLSYTFEVVIFTARIDYWGEESKEAKQAVADYLEEHDLFYDRIERKPMAVAYVDDRGYRVAFDKMKTATPRLFPIIADNLEDTADKETIHPDVWLHDLLESEKRRMFTGAGGKK